MNTLPDVLALLAILQSHPIFQPSQLLDHSCQEPSKGQENASNM